MQVRPDRAGRVEPDAVAPGVVPSAAFWAYPLRASPRLVWA